MFESIRSLFTGVGNVWLGTESDYLTEIAQPIMTGATKNTFQLSDVEKIGVATKSCKTIAENIGRLPVNLYQTTDMGNEILKTDSLQYLLRTSPDGVMTSNSFFSAIVYNMALKGNSWARVHRNRVSGLPERLELIPSNQVEGYKFVRGQLYWVYYKKLENKETKKFVVNNQDMLHFHYVAKNGLYGLNPVESQRLSMSTLWKSKQTQDNFYTNSAWTPAFLKSTVPDAQFLKPFSEAMKQFKDKNVGIANAGSIGMLPPFTDIVTMPMSIVDTEFLAGQAVDGRSIAGWWGVPPELIGLETGTFKNIEELTLNFKTYTLGPIISMMKSEMEFKLLTSLDKASGKSIDFVVQELMAVDIKSKLQYYKDLFGMSVITANQIATLEGFPKFEGGDTHYIPTNNLTSTEDVPDVDMEQDSSIGDTSDEDDI